MTDMRFSPEEMRTGIAHALANYAQNHHQHWHELVADGGIELLADPLEFEVCLESGQRFVVSVREEQR